MACQSYRQKLGPRRPSAQPVRLHLLLHRWERVLAEAKKRQCTPDTLITEIVDVWFCQTVPRRAEAVLAVEEAE